jgi:hypothetical protein
MFWKRNHDYHPDLPLYLPADCINKTRIKVHYSINSLEHRILFKLFIFLSSNILNLISTFLLLSLGRYLCWWTFSPRGYHPPSSQSFYHWDDTSAGGLLVPDGIIRPVTSASELTCFIRYIYYWNLQAEVSTQW